MSVRVGLTILLAASALLSLVAAAVWLLGVFPEREALGKTSKDQTIIAAPPSSSPAAGRRTSSVIRSAAPPRAPRPTNPAGIPNLGVMDVVGNLKYFATDVPFHCTGSTVTEGDSILWSCAANTRSGRGSYDVILVGDDPLTVFSVTATVHGVSEETAASYFSYVAGLCLRDTDPLNPEAWMQENVPTGGQIATGRTALSVYGTKEVRTLEVVAIGAF